MCKIGEEVAPRATPIPFPARNSSCGSPSAAAALPWVPVHVARIRPAVAASALSRAATVPPAATPVSTASAPSSSSRQICSAHRRDDGLGHDRFESGVTAAVAAGTRRAAIGAGSAARSHEFVKSSSAVVPGQPAPRGVNRHEGASSLPLAPQAPVPRGLARRGGAEARRRPRPQGPRPKRAQAQAARRGAQLGEARPRSQRGAEQPRGTGQRQERQATRRRRKTPGQWTRQSSLK